MSAIIQDTPGLEQGDIDSYMEYGRVQGLTGLLMALWGTFALFSLRSFFGGAIIIAIIEGITGVNIPGWFPQQIYYITSMPVYHTRKYYKKGGIISVKGSTRGFLSMVGALGLNWFIAFLPDYQLYQTLDFFADLLDELSLSDDDSDTEAAMSWFYTNSPLFGSWFVGKIGLLGW